LRRDLHLRGSLYRRPKSAEALLVIATPNLYVILE
jgi:hypothetical protein